MRAFLDFEASSLAKASYPIEVAWVFEDGREEAHLIRPAADWTDWDDDAEAIHGLSRAELLSSGDSPRQVATRMIEALDGHELLAGAPSWDGKWLSVLLRAGGFPRHALRLGKSSEARAAAALAALSGIADAAERNRRAAEAMKTAEAAIEAEPVAHRALPDARREYRLWKATAEIAARLGREQI
ncbi:MAG TPA: transcriptional regulator [Alphaproteobacteria bacterium]|nr:transcriptional regulator [Alphaproteobacteria bacterium]